MSVAPDIPTVAEMGLPGLSYSEWGGLFAPKSTPQEIIGRLNAAAVEALSEPAVRARVTEFGTEIFPRDQQTRSSRRAGEGRCREMVANHQGGWH
jgi:tripartite-type tricarboxylate transporter receptor subunit TctC